MTAFTQRQTLVCWVIAFRITVELAIAGPDPPAELLARLGSEAFKERQMAQEELTAWARRQPEECLEGLYLQSQTHPEPEVRSRCRRVLYDLVVEDYMKHGEGYMGITIQPVPAAVPGNEAARIGMQVTFVVPGSPAAKAGLAPGDVIVGADDQVWHQEDAMLFTNWAREQHPGQCIKLRILKAGKVAEVPLVLERRPSEVESMLPFGGMPDLGKVEQDEKDRHFKEWLDKRKSRR